MNPDSGGCDDRNDLRGTSPSIDETLQILGHPIRRDVVDCCVSAPGPIVEVDELADHVTRAREAAGESVDREQLLAEFHHRHLPMMAERGLLEFDPRSGQLRYRCSDRVERWLERIRAEEPD